MESVLVLVLVLVLALVLFVLFYLVSEEQKKTKSVKSTRSGPPPGVITPNRNSVFRLHAGADACTGAGAGAGSGPPKE